MNYTINPFSERAILLELEAKISLKNSHFIHSLHEKILDKPLPWYIDSIPAFNSLTIEYDPFEIKYSELLLFIEEMVSQTSLKNKFGLRVLKIPVCYEPEFGIDIEKLATSKKINIKKVIKWHTNEPYLVSMIGFSPGFPYMGPLPKQISLPRKTSPRTFIPSGSVGIGNNQTGVYPQGGASGWNIIGQTPIALFDISRKDPFLIKAGDAIHFQEINKKEFLKIKENNSTWNIHC